MRRAHISRTRLVPVLVLLLGLVAIGAITLLLQRSDDSATAERRLAEVKIQLLDVNAAPFTARAATGGSPRAAATRMRVGKLRIRDTLSELRRDSPPAALARVDRPLRTQYAALDAIYAIGASGREYGHRADLLAAQAGRRQTQVSRLLYSAGIDYHRRAERARTRAAVGAAAAILLLLAAFGVFYRRAISAAAAAEGLARENHRLLAASREEATTDALTGLLNRRALMRDLDDAVGPGAADAPRILALYDLDGFKQYNDTFGHPAGDALLSRLGGNLRRTMSGLGTAYRMGGDEFCVLVPAGDEAGEPAIRAAGAALAESGESFSIGSTHGAAYIPAEVGSGPGALQLADQRMYENKAGRMSAGRQSADVLLKVLSERTPELAEHLHGVARLAGLTAERMGLERHEIKRIRLAGQLHDIGKTAIPDAVLNKPSKLDGQEWEFIRRHTLIGERIIRSAPSLAHTAGLVRSSHERHDGSGYPDGLEGDAIPLGASIIAVCDAYDAMLADRPYGSRRTGPEALAELRSCAGTQFRPEVVTAFCAMVEEPASQPGSATAPG
jgi:diguanylate cyclase (GGDEF)-like protein